MSLDRVHRSGTNSEACQEGHIAEIHLQSHVQMGAGLLLLLLDLYTCVNGYKMRMCIHCMPSEPASELSFCSLLIQKHFGALQHFLFSLKQR